MSLSMHTSLFVSCESTDICSQARYRWASHRTGRSFHQQLAQVTENVEIIALSKIRADETLLAEIC